MHSALAIANYFINTALQQGVATKDFPPLKVHGLVYLAHGWLLGSAGAGVIDGQLMADKDGVFVPELKAAGCWGTKNVTQLVSVVELDAKRGLMVEQTPQLAAQNPTTQALAWIWKTYGGLTSFAIGQHIQEAGSPWEKVWHAPDRRGEEPRPVPNPMIKAWFRSLSGMRAEQGANSKLTRTQQRELRPQVERTEIVQKRPVK